MSIYTKPSDPRIPVGTRVRYTEQEDPGLGKWYRGLADGTGTVGADDGTNDAPYRIDLDEPYPNTIMSSVPDYTVLADFAELEILP